MTSKDLREAPLHSMKNHKAVNESETCGCYHCVQTFSKHDITQWTDGGKTAICPKCHVDAVLAQSSGIPIDTESLQALYDHWFK